MGWSLQLGAQAARDLEEIVRYIARDDPAAANRFGLTLLARAESLRRAPRLGIRVRGWPGLRALLHGRYYVVYRCVESGECIEVVRFWRSARDLRVSKAEDQDADG